MMAACCCCRLRTGGLSIAELHLHKGRVPANGPKALIAVSAAPELVAYPPDYLLYADVAFNASQLYPDTYTNFSEFLKVGPVD